MFRKIAILIPLLLLGACAWNDAKPLPDTACLSVTGPATTVTQTCNSAIRSKNSV